MVGARMRCPDDEIGRNSVMPWMSASTTICSMGMVGPRLVECRESLADPRLPLYMPLSQRPATAACRICDFESSPPRRCLRMPKLHHFPLDPFSRRMRLALFEYGVGADLVDEEPWSPSPAVLAFGHAGMLPVFIGDDGAVVSGVEAITEYLEETLGK